MHDWFFCRRKPWHLRTLALIWSFLQHMLHVPKEWSHSFHFLQIVEPETEGWTKGHHTCVAYEGIQLHSEWCGMKIWPMSPYSVLCCVCVCSVMSNSATPWTVVRQAPLSMGILQARILDWVAMPSPPGHLFNSGIERKSPALQVDSLPFELPGKPKNTGVGSLSFLQGIFPTQGLNPDLPHSRQNP